MEMLKHYKSSILFTIAVLLAGFAYGFYATGSTILALGTVGIMAVLGVLEVSLSFDNAVANAKVLQTMDSVWQKRFLTWGMIIAVFGMRVLFPLVIVAVAGHIGIVEALTMAVNDPKQYASTLTSAHILIVGFGGAFLMLVSLNYFLDEEKETHWFGALETRLQKLGSAMGATITLIVLVALWQYVIPAYERDGFLISGLLGIVAHEIIGRLGDMMGTEDDLTVTVAKQGLMSFIYLEVLDASFSFDGVIGAFVLSTNIFIIAGGLGIGAMFVRSMTLHLVESGTLSEYKYLEHGAFWSIFVLSGIMFASAVLEIPEYVTGGLSVILIVGAFLHSLYENKKEEAAVVA
jgi:hypothetical protein